VSASADFPGAREAQESQPPSLRTVAMPADANPSGDIFGGWIMSQMDLAGAIFASYRVKGRLVTVAVEGMNFHRPVFVGDQVSCYCKLKHTGTTSLSVHIETWVRRKQTSALLLITVALPLWLMLRQW